jgi:hypothetical protein
MKMPGCKPGVFCLYIFSMAGLEGELCAIDHVYVFPEIRNLRGIVKVGALDTRIAGSNIETIARTFGGVCSPSGSCLLWRNVSDCHSTFTIRA